MLIVPVPTGFESSATKEMGDHHVDLRLMTDPWERARLANYLADFLQRISASVLGVRRDAVRELVHQHGAAHQQVALHLGVSRVRVGQLAQEAAKLAAKRGDIR